MVFFKKAYGGGSHVPLGVLPLYLYLFSWLLQLKSAPFSLRNPVAGERRHVWIKNSHKLPNISRSKQRILWSLMPNESRESVFMLFVAISSIFMSLFKGHVACWNFSLTGSHYTQLFLHPLPRVTNAQVEWSNGGKNENLKKILYGFPQNSKPPKQIPWWISEP